MNKSILLFAAVAMLGVGAKGQTVTDVEGNVYNTIIIGNQLWMQENLKTTKYNDGSDIAYPGGNNTSWQNNTSGAYAWYNNDSVTYGNTYGALYKWFTLNAASNGGKNICPSGWHVPTHNEWTTMERAICSSASCITDFPINLTTTGLRGTDEGGKLKETGITHWLSLNTGATNSTGFTALPGGYRLTSGSYSGMQTYGYWWTSTVDNSFYYNAWIRDLYYDFTTIERIAFRKDCGLSVRCICDTLLTTQVDENAMDEMVKIYPNPATNRVEIILNNTNAGLNFELFDLTGTIVKQALLKDPVTSIGCEDLHAGLYIYRITNSAGFNVSGKLAVQ